jgi:hypothetical protein
VIHQAALQTHVPAAMRRLRSRRYAVWSFHDGIPALSDVFRRVDSWHHQRHGFPPQWVQSFDVQSLHQSA